MKAISRPSFTAMCHGTPTERGPPSVPYRRSNESGGDRDPEVQRRRPLDIPRMSRLIVSRSLAVRFVAPSTLARIPATGRSMAYVPRRDRRRGRLSRRFPGVPPGRRARTAAPQPDHGHDGDGGRSEASGSWLATSTGSGVPFLSSRLDPGEGGLDGPVGGASRPLFEPRSSGAVERSIVGHASRPSRAIGIRHGREGVPEPVDGVVESRSGRARGDAEQLGDLHERQPEVVMQHEDRPLLDREMPEGPLELVAIGDRRRVVGRGSGARSAGR